MTEEPKPDEPKPAEPVNKLHEWGAAIVIMVALAAVLAGFLYVMRRSTL